MDNRKSKINNFLLEEPSDIRINDMKIADQASLKQQNSIFAGGDLFESKYFNKDFVSGLQGLNNQDYNNPFYSPNQIGSAKKTDFKIDNN